MSKNLKLSYILTFVLFVISFAWQTLTNFFNGVGINFVAMLAITLTLMAIVIVDKPTRKRMIDLFVICALFVVMESIIYFALEFGSPTLDLYEGMHVYQNVIASLGFLFLAYTIFRLICEVNGTKIGFIEAMLGNKVSQKPRQPKELTNGSLENKPKNADLETLDSDADTTAEQTTSPVNLDTREEE